jgi:hypothetical protein
LGKVCLSPERQEQAWLFPIQAEPAIVSPRRRRAAPPTTPKPSIINNYIIRVDSQKASNNIVCSITSCSCKNI